MNNLGVQKNPKAQCRVAFMSEHSGRKSHKKPLSASWLAGKKDFSYRRRILVWGQVFPLLSKMESYSLDIEEVSPHILFSTPLLLPTELHLICSRHHKSLLSHLLFPLSYSGLVDSRWPKVESSNRGEDRQWWPCSYEPNTAQDANDSCLHQKLTPASEEDSVS